MTTAAPGRPQPRPGILEIEAYVPGKSSAKGAKIHKLSSNESPLGASPKAIAAYRATADHLERYPDGSATALRAAIAARYGLAADRIVCGAGSDELLQLLAHAYLGEGDEAVYSQYGFLVYPIAIASNGAKAVVAPETNQTTDVDAMIRAVTPKTRMVFLANPNNPTGTYIPFSEVKRLHAALPSHVLLVLDAAYAEFVRRNDYPEVDLAAAMPQVLLRYEGTPIGITWNGGLAITGNDYRHAAKTFTAYNADPASDAARKVSDRRRDPVHPSNHLDALLYKR